MKEIDGRKLSHAALEETRIRAVKRVDAGESQEVVIDALGFHRSAIYRVDLSLRRGWRLYGSFVKRGLGGLHSEISDRENISNRF
jgi:hypothetical protein